VVHCYRQIEDFEAAVGEGEIDFGNVVVEVVVVVAVFLEKIAVAVAVAVAEDFEAVEEGIDFGTVVVFVVVGEAAAVAGKTWLIC
jgi:hypothetical protein